MATAYDGELKGRPFVRSRKDTTKPQGGKKQLWTISRVPRPCSFFSSVYVFGCLPFQISLCPTHRPTKFVVDSSATMLSTP
eukprot:scaffold185733_cov36-Tisochrysis_lutea.AAC.3